MKEESDYIFRYAIEGSKQVASRDPLREMIRIELESLLNLLSLYHEGEEVKVDAFRLMNEQESLHPIFPERDARELCWPSSNSSASEAGVSLQSTRNAELYEPRIPHIKKVLQSILSVADLEFQGKPVPIDGFRLKNLKHWLVPSVGDPAEVFDHLATRCDCRCGFCYIRGNPPSLALEQPSRTPEEEYDEAKTRLKYFSPSQKRSLFPTMGSPHEFLSHSHALELLRDLRKKTELPLRLSTNGNNLDAEMIRRLASLKPIYLYLSLNSSSPNRRRSIMGTSEAETAIRSLPLLKEAQIPYAVVIVPWPVPSIQEMVSDLRETLHYSDQNEAHLAEISLPGYSRYFPHPPKFELEEAWSSVVSTARSVREEVATPVVVKPSLFEEGKFGRGLNLPLILGVVKNSPAFRSGLKIGDRILSIGGITTSSRPQARDLLHLHHQRRRPFAVSVQRGRETLEILLPPEPFEYPYSPETDHHLGIIFAGAGFRPSLLEELKAVITGRGAKRVLILSSRLVRPVFLQLVQQSSLFGNISIHVEVPENGLFGGNIFMGDLLVVQDFIGAIKKYSQENPPPDLVVIPSSPFSLGQWRRDLEGRPAVEIERAVNLPVAILDCEPIYD